MNTENWANKELAGWGRYPVIEASCLRPERRSEVIDAVRNRGDRPLLAYGLGRSYGDAALLREGGVVLNTRLNRMLSFDEESGWLRCEGGVSISEIVETFLPRGWFPPVVPGTQFVTVGGAIGCNIHGKNHGQAGCFGDHIRRIELLTAQGEVVICGPDRERELFWATVGGMGLTGIILTVEVQLYPVESSMIEQESIRFENLDEFFEVSAESGDYLHTVSWIDCVQRGADMGRGIFMRGRHARGNSEATGGPGLAERMSHWAQTVVDGRLFQSNHLLNKATIRLFNEAYFRRHSPGIERATISHEPFFFPLDAVKNWNFIYGSRGFLQYQMVVPEREGVREILENISSSGMASFLAVIKEFGRRDHGGLSFPCAGTTLALDFPNYGPDLFALLQRLDEIVVAAGGRVYLGKDARLSRAAFQQMYPRWRDWKEVRDRWDPTGAFQSELGKRLGLVIES